MMLVAATTVPATIAGVTGIMAEKRSNNAALHPMLDSIPIGTTESLKEKNRDENEECQEEAAQNPIQHGARILARSSSVRGLE